jgi:release factor glutamine methyltransferase
MTTTIAIDELSADCQTASIAPEELSAIRRFAGRDEALFRRSVKRFLLGDPLTYVTNSCCVLGREFYVDRRVYRPSQNTEKLVRHALGLIDDGKRILDVGTGCGWIAITAQLEKPASIVWGVDIDHDAINVARHNAHRYGVDVTFVASDLLESLPAEPPDYVIANLPYGTPNSGRTYSINAHLPRIALYHPRGPFAAFTELLESIRARGWHPEVFVEAGSLGVDIIRSAIPAGVAWDLVRVDEKFAIVHAKVER